MSATAALRIKKTLADAIRQKMAHDKLNITTFARKTKTGRNAVKRILDGRNTSITLKTMTKAAEALDLELTLAAKPLSSAKLDAIAGKIIGAETEAEAQQFKEEYIAGFYGKSVRQPAQQRHAKTPAV